MGPRLAVIVSKCPRLKNVYKSNRRCLKSLSVTTKGTKEGNNRKSSVYTLHKIGSVWRACLWCKPRTYNKIRQGSSYWGYPSKEIDTGLNDFILFIIQVGV